MIRSVTLIAPLLLALGCVSASRRGPVVEPVWNETAIAPKAIFDAHLENPIAAKDQLEFKRLRVQGVVAGIGDGAANDAVIMLADAADQATTIWCDGLPRRSVGLLRRGQVVTVTGFFTFGAGVSYFAQLAGCALETTSTSAAPVVTELAAVKPSAEYRDPILVDAQDLDAAFGKDAEAAQVKYGAAPLVVRGRVRYGPPSSRFTNDLSLHTGNPLRFVICHDLPEFAFKDLEEVTVRAWFRFSGLTGTILVQCIPVHGDKTDAAPTRAL